MVNYSAELIDKERLGKAKIINGVRTYVPFESDNDVIRRLNENYYLDESGTKLIPLNKNKNQEIKL